jgi:hypothetical protein
MPTLRDQLTRHDESLADCVERLAIVVGTASPSVQKRYRTEILDFLNHPETVRLGTGLAGKVGVNESAEILHQRLRIPSLTAGDYNSYLLALGQLGYGKAANTIEAYFLQGKTKAAATVALLLLDPLRAEATLHDYAVDNRAEGTAVAGIALLEQYEKGGLNSVAPCTQAIPKQLLKRVPAMFALPKELASYLRAYTRRN